MASLADAKAAHHPTTAEKSAKFLGIIGSSRRRQQLETAQARPDTANISEPMPPITYVCARCSRNCALATMRAIGAVVVAA
jgi:hypothetical protein